MYMASIHGISIWILLTFFGLVKIEAVRSGISAAYIKDKFQARIALNGQYRLSDDPPSSAH